MARHVQRLERRFVEPALLIVDPQQVGVFVVAFGRHGPLGAFRPVEGDHRQRGAIGTLALAEEAHFGSLHPELVVAPASEAGFRAAQHQVLVRPHVQPGLGCQVVVLHLDVGPFQGYVGAALAVRFVDQGAAHVFAVHRDPERQVCVAGLRRAGGRRLGWRRHRGGGLLGRVLVPDGDFHPAVARHAFGCGVAGDRGGFAFAAHGHRLCRQVQLATQVVGHGQGPGFGEALVVPEQPPGVGREALVVGVAYHRQAQAGLAGVALGQGREAGLGGRQQVGLARFEQGADAAFAQGFLLLGAPRRQDGGGRAHGPGFRQGHPGGQRVGKAFRLHFPGRRHRVHFHTTVVDALALTPFVAVVIGPTRRDAAEHRQGGQGGGHGALGRQAGQIELGVHSLHVLVLAFHWRSPFASPSKDSVSITSGGVARSSSFSLAVSSA